MPYGSCAVTVRLNATLVVAAEGAVTTSFEAAAAVTVSAFEMPVMDAVTVSVAVKVCDPEVLKVTETVPNPLASNVFAGNTAWESELVNFTVPV